MVRKKTHGVETRSHSHWVFRTPAFGGGFVLGNEIERDCPDGVMTRLKQWQEGLRRAVTHFAYDVDQHCRTEPSTTFRCQLLIGQTANCSWRVTAAAPWILRKARYMASCLLRSWQCLLLAFMAGIIETTPCSQHTQPDRVSIATQKQKSLKNVVFKTIYRLGNLTQSVDNVLTAAKFVVNWIDLHKKHNAFGARYWHSHFKDGIASCSLLLCLPCLGIISSVVWGW